MKCRNCKNNTSFNDGVQYNWCMIWKDNLDIDEERECETFSHATNFDRIRAMTEDELAEFLQKIRGGCMALTTESYSCNFYTDDLNTDCKACWLDWLKQEVKDD